MIAHSHTPHMHYSNPCKSKSTKRRPACSHAVFFLNLFIFALVTNQGRKCGSMLQKHDAKKSLNATHSPPTAPHIFPALLCCCSVAIPEYSKHHRLIAVDRYTLVGREEFLLQDPGSQQTVSVRPVRRCRTLAWSRTGKGHLVMEGYSQSVTF